MLAYLEVPAATVEALRAIAHDRTTIMALVVLVLVILGIFIDLAPKILIATPIFLPVVKAYGIDPLQFGVVLILAGGLGLVSPPIGSVLFVGTAIGRISIGETLRTIWPFWLAALLVLLSVAFVPALSLWLPAAMK
jgi:TRAP-type C4-dicarboxylate transport system permease large subunit